MEVTQTDKAITLDCGCNVDIIITAYSVSNLAVQGALNQCPLHRATDDLLTALKEIANGPWSIGSMREIAGHAIEKTQKKS